MTRRHVGFFVGLAMVALVACGGGGDDAAPPTTVVPDLSVDFTPVPGTPVDPSEVVDEVVAAVRALAASPVVEITSVGFTENRRSDISAVVDTPGRRMWLGEVISDATAVGGPLAADPIVSELVVIGNDAWLRVLQPGQPDDTPFQFIDATGLAEQYRSGAFTQAGRVFDRLDVIAALLESVDFTAERLDGRDVAGLTVSGVRATFEVDPVGEFLADRGFAVTHAHDGEFHEHSADEALVLEFWYDEAGLRELVATGVQFQDGEALDTSARITYRVLVGATIEPPTNTVAP